jgi:Skp family chaperone for outer membrane proteins
MASLVVVFLFALPLAAQDEVKEKPKKQSGTKIAVLNLKVVFEQYKRARAFRAELEVDAKPYRDKAAKLNDDIKAYEKAIAKPTVDPAKRRTFEDAIRQRKFELEELKIHFTRALTQKHEEKLEVLWKEITVGTDAIAKTYGFHVVLPVGEPECPMPTLQPPEPNLVLAESESVDGIPWSLFVSNPPAQPAKRDFRAPLYVHASVDLTPVVVATLNRWASEGNDKQGAKENTPPPWGYR